jgi:hypothetical protein
MKFCLGLNPQNFTTHPTKEISAAAYIGRLCSFAIMTFPTPDTTNMAKTAQSFHLNGLDRRSVGSSTFWPELLLLVLSSSYSREGNNGRDKSPSVSAIDADSDSTDASSSIDDDVCRVPTSDQLETRRSNRLRLL